jgi:hypothetical protein
MKYKKKYIDIINNLRNKKELNFLSGLLKKQKVLKFESFVPKLKNNFKKAILEKGLNYKNQLKEFIENIENNKPKNIEKFIGIHFSENNLIISHLNRTKEKLEIKRTVQVELPGDLVGKDKVDNIEGLTKVIEDIISIYKLKNVPILLTLGSDFFKNDSFTKDSILIEEDKFKIIESKSPYLLNESQFLINELEGDKYTNYTNVLYANKTVIESWIKVLKILNHPIVSITNGSLAVCEYLNNINKISFLIDICRFNTTIYFTKRNCELITFNLPYGSDLYSKESKDIRNQYFERLNNSIKQVLNKIGYQEIKDIYITGSGLQDFKFTRNILPYKFKLLDTELDHYYSQEIKENKFNYIFNQYSQILSDNNFTYNFLDQYEDLEIWDPNIKESSKSFINLNSFSKLNGFLSLVKKEKILYYPSLFILLLSSFAWIFSSVQIFNVIRLKNIHNKYLSDTNKLQMVVQSINSDINKVVDHSKFYSSSLEGFLFGKFLEDSIPEGIQVMKFEVNKDLFKMTLNGRNLKEINYFLGLIRNNPIINKSSLQIARINSLEDSRILNSSQKILNNKFGIEISGKLNYLTLEKRIERNLKYSNFGKFNKYKIFSDIKNLISQP